MANLDNLSFSKSHEWVRFHEDGSASIGLSDYAQQELGDLVFVNLPEVGDTLTLDEAFADVESVKAVSDVYAPLSGVVKEINEALLDSPQLINESAYDAWLIKVEDISEKGEFLTAEGYQKFLDEQA